MSNKDAIIIKGLSQNNLKHVSLAIPKGKIVYLPGCLALESQASYLIRLQQKVRDK